MDTSSSVFFTDQMLTALAESCSQDLDWVKANLGQILSRAPDVVEGVRACTQHAINSDPTLLGPYIPARVESEARWINGYNVSPVDVSTVESVFPDRVVMNDPVGGRAGGLFPLFSSVLIENFSKTMTGQFLNIHICSNEVINTVLNARFHLHYRRVDLDRDGGIFSYDSALVMKDSGDLSQCLNGKQCRCDPSAPLYIDHITTKINVDGLRALLAGSASTVIEGAFVYHSDMELNLPGYSVNADNYVGFVKTCDHRRYCECDRVVKYYTRDPDITANGWSTNTSMPVYTLDEVRRLYALQLFYEQGQWYYKENLDDTGGVIRYKITRLGAERPPGACSPMAPIVIPEEEYLVSIPESSVFDPLREFYPYDFYVKRRVIDGVRKTTNIRKPLSFDAIMQKLRSTAARVVHVHVGQANAVQTALEEGQLKLLTILCMIELTTMKITYNLGGKDVSDSSPWAELKARFSAHQWSETLKEWSTNIIDGFRDALDWSVVHTVLKPFRVDFEIDDLRDSYKIVIGSSKLIDLPAIGDIWINSFGSSDPPSNGWGSNLPPVETGREDPPHYEEVSEEDEFLDKCAEVTSCWLNTRLTGSKFASNYDFSTGKLNVEEDEDFRTGSELFSSAESALNDIATSYSLLYDYDAIRKIKPPDLHHRLPRSIHDREGRGRPKPPPIIVGHKSAFSGGGGKGRLDLPQINRRRQPDIRWSQSGKSTIR